MTKSLPAVALVCLAGLLTLTACVSQAQTSDQSPASEFGEPRQLSPQTMASALPQDQILNAQAYRARKTEVVFSARVRKLLPDDTKGLPHQRFLLDLSNGTTVLVAHNTRMAPKVPLKAGDIVTIKGEYIWNDKGGVVHWTHRSDTPEHQGGYIDYLGQKYQ